MTNFTDEIKSQITENFTGGRQSALSALSAFIRTSGTLITEGGNYGFELSTESRTVADFFTDILERVFALEISGFSSRSDISSGKEKLVFSCVNSQTQELLLEAGILGSDDEGLFVNISLSADCKDAELCKACLIGAFLGGGSCTVPDLKSYSRTGYHLEIVFRNKITADDFCDVLCNLEQLPKLVMRKDSAVVYFKSKESIAALLNLMGAERAAEKLNRIAEVKDGSNNLNRVNNCSVSNIDKTVTASVNQVRAIEIIRSTIGLQSLDENLFSVAEGRLADKNASMQELADRLKISKSCLNHRMRKLAQIASSLERD